MPNRIVREAILSSERVAHLGWPEEVFYRRLMSIVDDYGRTEANLQLLRSRCYPLQTDNVRTADISRWMAACQKAGLILGYEVAGKHFVEVNNFGQQQRSASKCPAPPATDSGCNQLIANEHLDVSVSVDVIPPSPQGGDPPHRKRVSTLEAERPESVPEEVWRDFTALRRTKRALLTPTALAGIEQEASKAGIPLADALATCCRKGWQGFEADWMSKLKPAEKQAWAGAK